MRRIRNNYELVASMASRNITLSLPDDLVRRAKVLAAQRDTSVSALVGQLLEQVAGTSMDYGAAWAEEELLMEGGTGFSLGEVTWSRDQVHER